MDLDHRKFFDGFKAAFDPSLEQSQVDGLEFLLTSFENEPVWDDLRHIAYAFATIAHETNFSFRPVEEGYYLAKYGQTRVKNFQKSLRYYPYFGRGYVQLTWLKNYRFAGKQLGEDLVNHPELALTPEIAFKVLTLGMHDGWFTTHKLSEYINADETNYVESRRIINGTDKAALIAGYARKFERILTNAGDAQSTGTRLSGSDDQEPPPDTSNKPDPVVVEKDVTIGFFQRIKLKLTAWLTAIGGLTGLQQYKDQLTNLGLPGWLLVYLLLAVVVVFLIWLIYEGIAHLVGIWSRRSLTNALIKANATPENTVIVACPDDLDKYAQLGYKVVRRQ